MITRDKLQSARETKLPENFSESISPGTLLRLVYETVEAIAWPKPSAVPNFDTTPIPVLRTLLTYCFSVGIYGSMDIQAAVRTDPVIRYICANDFPRWETIRLFRRQNMPWLRAAFAKLSQLAVEQGLALQPGGNGGWARRAWESPGAVDYNVEAERRLLKAIQADSMSMDD